MNERRTCDTHDMRPMPSMRATVCRRCGYYEPQPGDNDGPPMVSVALRRITLGLAALTIALTVTGFLMWR